MNENEFEFGGKVYVTEPMEDRSCLHCALYELHEACISSRCLASQRSDKTQMIHKEKEMAYCHVSTQCDKHAEEEGRKQALEDEIERVADDLLCKLPSWVITDETYMLARNEAERIVKLKMRGIE